MPIQRFSRHLFTQGLLDQDDVRFLSDRAPFRYVELPDNREHIVKAGDTLSNLAYRYFDPLPGAAQLWWIIADFQPDPIHDPTVTLDVGRRLFIPSVATVTDIIFNQRRRKTR